MAGRHNLWLFDHRLPSNPALPCKLRLLDDCVDFCVDPGFENLLPKFPVNKTLLEGSQFFIFLIAPVYRLHRPTRDRVALNEAVPNNDAAVRSLAPVGGFLDLLPAPQIILVFQRGIFGWRELDLVVAL
jgi:hypothetical protein